MDIKLNKGQISKRIQSGGFLRDMLGCLGNIAKELGKKRTELAISLARYNLSGLVSNLASNPTSNATGKLGRKISGKGAVRTGKGFT